jgi:hypothetical protein
MTDDTPTVPCTLCSTPTPMTATKLCTRCWELSRRIRRDPELAASILLSLPDAVENLQRLLRRGAFLTNGQAWDKARFLCRAAQLLGRRR